MIKWCWRPQRSGSSHTAEQSRTYAAVFRFVSFPSVSSAIVRLPLFHLSKGRRRREGKKGRRRGIRYCHTLVRVHA